MPSSDPMNFLILSRNTSSNSFKSAADGDDANAIDFRDDAAAAGFFIPSTVSKNADDSSTTEWSKSEVNPSDEIVLAGVSCGLTSAAGLPLLGDNDVLLL